MNTITPCLWFDTQAGEAAKSLVDYYDDKRLLN